MLTLIISFTSSAFEAVVTLFLTSCTFCCCPCSCMEMVIIRATKGCQHHDSRLHIGKMTMIKTLEISLLQKKSALKKMNVQELLPVLQ